MHSSAFSMSSPDKFSQLNSNESACVFLPSSSLCTWTDRSLWETPKKAQTKIHTKMILGASAKGENARQLQSAQNLTKRIIIMRHGQTDWNEEKRIQGTLDFSRLTEKGQKQAAVVAHGLLSFKIDKLYVSSLTRARHTLEILQKIIHQMEESNALVQMEPVIVDALKEIQFPWQGSYKFQVEESFPEYVEYNKNRFKYQIDGFNPYQDLFARVSGVMNEILEQNCGNSLVVAHNRTNQAFLTLLLNLPMEKVALFQQNNCCLNMLEYDRLSSVKRLRCHNALYSNSQHFVSSESRHDDITLFITSNMKESSKLSHRLSTQAKQSSESFFSEFRFLDNDYSCTAILKAMDEVMTICPSDLEKMESLLEDLHDRMSTLREESEFYLSARPETAEIVLKWFCGIDIKDENIRFVFDGAMFFSKVLIAGRSPKWKEKSVLVCHNVSLSDGFSLRGYD